MAERRPIGIWSYNKAVHTRTWNWTLNHWRAALFAASILTLCTLVALPVYAVFHGIEASWSEIAPSVVLPCLAAAVGPVVLYVVGLLVVPAQMHAEHQAIIGRLLPEDPFNVTAYPSHSDSLSDVEVYLLVTYRGAGRIRRVATRTIPCEDTCELHDIPSIQFLWARSEQDESQIDMIGGVPYRLDIGTVSVATFGDGPPSPFRRSPFSSHQPDSNDRKRVGLAPRAKGIADQWISRGNDGHNVTWTWTLALYSDEPPARSTFRLRLHAEYGYESGTGSHVLKVDFAAERAPGDTVENCGPNSASKLPASVGRRSASRGG